MVSFKQDCINLLSRHGKDKNIPSGVLANFIESSLRNLDKVYEDCISKVKVSKTTKGFVLTTGEDLPLDETSIFKNIKSVTPETGIPSQLKDEPVVLPSWITNDMIVATGQTGEIISEKEDLPVVELENKYEKLSEDDKVKVDKLINKW